MRPTAQTGASYGIIDLRGLLRHHRHTKEWKPLRAYAEELKIKDAASKQAAAAAEQLLASKPKVRKIDLMNKGPTGGDGAVIPGSWMLIEEGVGTFRRPIWWNVITDQKIDCSITRPDASELPRTV